MANKVKSGLAYFPFEVNFFKDIKLRKLIKYQGCKATPIYTLLLCNIYENGYYLRWDNELPFMISETTGYEEGYIKEVFNCCLKVGLFSEKMFVENKVITSKGIQERYQLICKQIKKRVSISEYNIIDTEELPIVTEEMAINTEEMTQRKGKEIKEKENKENYSPANFEKIFVEVMGSAKWIEEICIHHQLKIPFVVERLEYFLNDLKLKNDYHKGLKEIKSHFINWLKKEKEKSSAKKESKTVTQAQDLT